MKSAYTQKEAAAEVGVSVDVVRDAIRTHDLPVRFPTTRPVIRHEDLIAWRDSWPTERKG